MHYVCVENSNISAILNYEPNVPDTVKVYQITDEEHLAISQGVKTFDVSSHKVVDVDEGVLDQKRIQDENMQKNAVLSSTDWQVLRHLREKALGLKTTLTEAQYVALENRRQNIAKSIVN